MTKPEQPKPVPLPLLLVYGKPTSPDLPQASWFRAEDRPGVTAAAQALKFALIDIATEEDRAVLAGVHEGVLKAAGRLIVGSVAADVYKRIEEYVAKANAAPSAKASSDVAAGPNSPKEQNTNNGEKPPGSTAPDPWDGLRVGSHVAAKYWLPSGEADGWWIAEITAINGKDFTLRWLDEPETPPLKAERKHVAILHPSFDVKREWDRKR